MRSWPWQKNHPRRGWWLALLIVLMLLVVVRLALPSIVKSIVNHKQADMGDGYQGIVDDVVIRTFDAEIGLRNFHIVKKNGLVPVPFMVVKELVLGFVLDSWQVRNTLHFIEPNASFVDAKTEERKQKGPSQTLNTLQGKLPFQLLRVEVERGTYHFRNFESKPNIDVVLAQNLNVVWDKLVHCLPPSGSSCRSNVEASALVAKSGKLKLKGTFARSPAIDARINGSLDSLRVPELNPVLAKYAKIDVAKGTADIEVRYDRRGKSHDILLVPYLHNFETVKGDDHEGMKFGRELGVAAAAGYFERKQGEKAISIKIKPSGDSDFALIDYPKSERDDKDKVDDSDKKDDKN